MTPEQLDQLAELVTIGVGRAAASLNDLARTHVQLSAPEIRLFNAGLAQELRERLGTSGLVGVQQRFRGELLGQALLVFSLASADRLTRRLLGGADQDIDVAVEREAVLTEVGNILINALMGSFANLLGAPLGYSMPDYLVGSAADHLLCQAAEEGTSLLIAVAFHLAVDQISGHLVVHFDRSCLGVLASCLDRVADQGWRA